MNNLESGWNTLPYITSGLKGIGGKLRALPSHFVVEELPLYEPTGKGEHLYVNLTKEGLTTRDVQKLFATFLGLNERDIGFAGLKHKKPRTTQTFSIPVGRLNKSDVELAIRRIQNEFPVTINWTRLHTNKLKIGHLAGNRFTVTITGIQISSKMAMERAEQIASLLRVYGLPNYFGPQRFGVDGNNVRKGRDLVLGKLKVNDRWLRRFLVDSYQSYLCNIYLALRVRRGLFHRVVVGDFARKYTTRSWFEVVDEEKEQRRYEAHEISFTAPIYGYRMPLARGVAGELEQEVLADFGLKLESFELVKALGSRRIGRIIPKDLRVEESPEGITLSFTLPRGGYATTVLREFIKTDSTIPEESYEEESPR